MGLPLSPGAWRRAAGRVVLSDPFPKCRTVECDMSRAPPYIYDFNYQTVEKTCRMRQFDTCQLAIFEREAPSDE